MTTGDMSLFRKELISGSQAGGGCGQARCILSASTLLVCISLFFPKYVSHGQKKMHGKTKSTIRASIVTKIIILPL